MNDVEIILFHSDGFRYLSIVTRSISANVILYVSLVQLLCETGKGSIASPDQFYQKSSVEICTGFCFVNSTLLCVVTNQEQNI